MNSSLGVNYFGFLSEISGIAESSRNNIEALKANGITVNPFSYRYHNTIVKDNNDPMYLSTKDDFSINIIHINIDKISTFLSEFTTNSLKGKYNIAYWAWEFPEIPEETFKILNLFDEIWVPSNFCAEIFSLKCNIPVIKISHVIKREEFNSDFKKSDYSIPENAFTYLTLFDSDSTFERKNPLDTINAFKNSFDKENLDVQLIIKTHNFDKNPHIKEIINSEISDFKNIIVIDEKMSTTKLHSLLQQCNVLISLHASEGFGLTIAEAMAYGKIVIATGYSGNLDFMNVNNSFCIKYSYSSIKKEHGIIKAGYTIAKPDRTHAQKLIQNAYSNNNEDISKNAIETIERFFNINYIGKQMSDRIKLIHESLLNKNATNLESLVIHDYEVEIDKLNKRIKYLEKSLYNKIRKGINKFFKKIKQKKE